MEPSYNPWGTPMFPSNAAFGTGSPQEDAQRQPNMLDNLLSHIAGALGRGFMAPGNALNSTTPITTEQMIKPAADIAGSMTLGAGAIPADLNALRMGIKAYHGSPHDFDRFDLSKIGTGEGAQAYGHGLYFAENEGVAKGYRDALARTVDTGDPRQMAAAQIGNHGGDRSLAIQFMKENLAAEAAKASPDAAWIAKYSPVLRELESGQPLPQSAGKMYEVNLNADPAHLLNWDTKLGQQPQAVQDVFKKQLEQFGPDAKMQSQMMIAGSRTPNGLRGVSENLANAGIPGIRYLDQGSRGVPAVNGRVQAIGGGGGFNIVDDFGVQAGPFPTLAEAKQYLDPGKNLSSNYVMFNDKLIDILRKYGIAGMTAPPIFAGAMGENKQ